MTSTDAIKELPSSSFTGAHGNPISDPRVLLRTLAAVPGFCQPFGVQILILLSERCKAVHFHMEPSSSSAALQRVYVSEKRV